MELMLPSSQSATGWLLLEQGDLAGRRYRFETSVCPSPVCQCERVTLRCSPELPELSPQDYVPVCLEMDLEKREIANFGKLKYSEVLAGDGSMVGYYEILPYAKPIEFTLGAQTWVLDDQHCVRAKCSCQEAVLSFFELRPSAQPSGNGSEPTLCIRYAYDTGQIEALSNVKDRRWSGKAFVDALKKVLPDVDSVWPSAKPCCGACIAAP